MGIKNYDDLNSLEIDTLREVGSIGTGNAATALSGLLNRRVRITLPEVRIMGYNEAIDWIGGPENVTAGVLVRISGDIGGIMLSVLPLEFVNMVLECMLDNQVEEFEHLDELQRSALVEVGGNFTCDDYELPCRLLLSPEIRGLNYLLHKLGVSDA